MTGRRSTERVRHYEGERLLATDLGESDTYETWRRALHVRAVHDTWGVALGYDLAPQWNVQRHLKVGPGFAYDAAANEILLSEAETLRLPSILPGQDMRYDLMLSAGPKGRPAFRWAEVTGAHSVTRPGIEIRLARIRLIVFFGVVIPVEISLTERDWSRAMIRPQMDSGVVHAGDHEWSRMQSGDPCIYISLPTGRAGTAATPVYLAWIERNEWLTRGEVPPVVSIDQSGSAVWLQLTFLADYTEKAAEERLAETTIRWFRIEPVSGLWPTLTAPPRPTPQVLRARFQEGNR